MKHTSDETVVREKMKITFQYRQAVVHSPEKSLDVLDMFLKFLDTPGLVSINHSLLNIVSSTSSFINAFYFLQIVHDFLLLFGEEWPTYFKKRVINDSKGLSSSHHIEELIKDAQHEPGDGTI